MNVEQEHEICFLILIGLPGSGKTTFSSFLAHCLEDSKGVDDFPFYCLVQVCYDKIINPADNPQWNEARRKIARTIDELIRKLKKCLDPRLLVSEYNLNIVVNKFSTNARILVVIDDNMYYRSMRYQYYQIARTHQASYCQLHLVCDVSTCLARNFQRRPDDQISENILLKMAGNLEEPNASNHAWETYSISFISDKPFSLNSLATLFKAINEAFSHPVQSVSENLERAQSQLICSSNIIHQADLVIRKIIGNTIREKKKELNHSQIQELSTHLNIKKQLLIQKLKSGKLKVPAEIIQGTEENSGAVHSFFEKQIF